MFNNYQVVKIIHPNLIYLFILIYIEDKKFEISFICLAILCIDVHVCIYIDVHTETYMFILHIFQTSHFKHN